MFQYKNTLSVSHLISISALFINSDLRNYQYRYYFFKYRYVFTQLKK